MIRRATAPAARMACLSLSLTLSLPEVVHACFHAVRVTSEALQKSPRGPVRAPEIRLLQSTLQQGVSVRNLP